MHTNGTFKQPFDVIIDIQKFYDFLEDTLRNLIEEYFASFADSASSEDMEFEIEDNCIVLHNLSYTGSYTHTHFDGTHLDPPEDDFELTPNGTDFREELLDKYLQTHAPDWLKPLIKTQSIRILDDYLELHESEPDWDSMPGGYDNF